MDTKVEIAILRKQNERKDQLMSKENKAMLA